MIAYKLHSQPAQSWEYFDFNTNHLDEPSQQTHISQHTDLTTEPVVPPFQSNELVTLQKLFQGDHLAQYINHHTLQGTYATLQLVYPTTLTQLVQVSPIPSSIIFPFQIFPLRNFVPLFPYLLMSNLRPMLKPLNLSAGIKPHELS